MRKIENLENLRVFCEVVETGSAREACEKLHIEPSNAFRIIRAMEKELKTKFFDRSQRPMKLTPEGKRYYSYVFRILQLKRNLKRSYRIPLTLSPGRFTWRRQPGSVKA